MVVQPSIEEHEALLKRVKALEKELKRVRNEKKETSRSPLEVEVQPKTRDRKASRNSWAEIYHNNTVRRKSVKLLGKDVVTDEWLDWRVKWGQRGISFSSLIALICFMNAGDKNIGFRMATIVFCAIGLIFVCMLSYKNVSFVVMKRLLREANVNPNLGNSNKFTPPDVFPVVECFSVHAKQDDTVSNRNANSHNARIGPDFGAPCNRSINT